MAQRDPLVEYQREGFQLFGAMMDGIKEESVGFLFNLEVQVEQTAPEEAEADEEAEVHVRAKGLEAPTRPTRLAYTAPSVDGDADAVHTESSGTTAAAVLEADGLDGVDFDAVERNAPCPCGSGKKFKRCHGDPKRRGDLEV
jgi:preprotein translocase subunit SecA